MVTGKDRTNTRLQPCIGPRRHAQPSLASDGVPKVAGSRVDESYTDQDPNYDEGFMGAMAYGFFF
jgi:hypothetical protein